MSSGATKPVDPERLELYQSQYYERTDLVYRFGLVLTSSRDGAERVTEETYRLLLEEFSRVKASIDATTLLMTLTWRAWNKLKSERFHEWAQPTLNTLKKLTIDERAAIYAVDIVGILPKEAANVLGASEQDVRMTLASARNKLTATPA